MRYAIVENGVVVNVAKSDSPLKSNWIKSDTANKKDLYDGDVFSSPVDSATLDEYKEEKIGFVVDKQYQVADSGIDVNGLFVATTIDSISEITGAVQGNGRNPTKIRKVNLRGGRIQADKATLEALAEAVDDYRQACHDRGYDICELISAATTKPEIDSILNTEMNIGWP